MSIVGVALIADVGDIREMAQDLPKPIPRLVKDYLEWVKSIRGYCQRRGLDGARRHATMIALSR